MGSEMCIRDSVGDVLNDVDARPEPGPDGCGRGIHEVVTVGPDEGGVVLFLLHPLGVGVLEVEPPQDEDDEHRADDCEQELGRQAALGEHGVDAAGGRQEHFAQDDDRHEAVALDHVLGVPAVSYTHLTLPTTYSA